MKRLLITVALPVALIVLFGSPLRADNVDIYSTFTGTPACCSTSGMFTPYSGLVGSFTSPDIQFFTNTGGNWHPFGQTNFGAIITGGLDVANSGTYIFTLYSDDGSQLFIDGNPTPVVDDSGVHGPAAVTNSIFLTAGDHPFQVDFFECCSNPAGVDLTLPSGVTYETPEPGTLTLLTSGLMMLGGGVLRRRRII
jgi:hypothetical protein